MRIEQEIKDWQDLNQDRDWHGYLNNFWCTLPGGRYRTKFKQVGAWTITGKKWLEIHYGDHPEYERLVASHSQLYLNQTGEEFFKTIDRVIKDRKISSRIIKGLVKKIDKHFYNSGLAMDHMRELYDLVLPAYSDLRNMGYNKSELTG